MSGGVGLNVSRRMIGGVGSSEVGSEVRAGTTQGSPPGVFRVVVVEVIYDPDFLTPEQKQLLKAQVTNPEFVDTMPPNTVVGRVVSAGQDLSSPNPALFYPFFSSHFVLPVQPGEQVSVMYEDLAQQGNSLGRWLSRVHESNVVEDVNYTHGDRRFDNSLVQTQRRTSADTNTTSSAESLIPNFTNGGGTAGSFSLQPGPNNSNPYNTIVSSSFVTKFSDPEPVPRWIKRPQEHLIQGMNNSLIMLGEDRTGPALRLSGSLKRDRYPYAGTVDIVCGRGRGNIPYNPEQNPDPTNEKTGTSPGVILNSRRKLETDKVPFKRDRNRRRSRNEGNPDFRRDAARVYVSMNTAGDRNFKTGHSTNPEEGINYPDNTIRPVQRPESPGGIGSSYVVYKADHIRIIARKETDPEIKGSFLLLREGTRDNDLVFVYGEEGKLQLEAKEIYFGKAVTKTEPYIKWTIYDKHITELKNQLKALADQVKDITTRYDAAFSLGNPYGLAAALVGISNTVKADTTTLVDGQVKSRLDSQIDTPTNSAKSVKCFGE